MQNDTPTQTCTARIASFADEAIYRRHFLRQDARTCAAFIALSILAHLLFSQADSLLLSSSPLLPWLLALRLGLMAFSGWAMAIILRTGDPQCLDRWSFAWALVTVFADLLIIPARPHIDAGPVAIDLVLIFALYIIQPGTTVFRVLPPLLLSVGSVSLSCTLRGFTEFVALLTTVSAYGGANIIGWIASANWHHCRRSSFFANRSLEQLCHQSEEGRRAAESSDRRWEKIFDASPALLLFIDHQYRISRINQATISRLGLTRNAIIGQPCYTLLCGAAAPPEGCLHRKAVEDGQEHRTEATLLPDKAECRVTTIPLFTAQGQLDCVFYAIEDLSEQKRSERELVRAREQYRTLVQNSHGIIYTINPDGVITYVSPSYTKLLGYPPGAIVGKHFQQVIHPEDVAACETFQRQILARGEISRGIEYRLFHRDGSICWHLSNFLPCRDEHGTIVSFVGNAMDITEQKQYQAELDRAREAAVKADRSKSDFLALVSHEIRTPLNAIVGFSALAQQTTDSTRLHAYVNILNQSSRVLMDLVNDILDMSKVEAGQLHLESIPFNLPDTVDLLQWQFAPVAERKNIALQVVKGDGLPSWVLGDPVRFRQIVSNLLSNAIKFTPKGSVTLTVTPAVVSPSSPRECRVQVAVRDTGIGIAQAHIATLFQPFQQLDPGIARKYGGTGLGLAIVHRLVELMDGQVEVASEEGQGCCFTVELPLPLSSAPQYEQMATEPHGTLTILVVEDNAFNRLLLRDTLQAWGYTVIEAEHALQALELLDEQHFDCIILDVRMPEVDGVELAARVRQLEQLADVTPTPIIAYTADTEGETRNRCLTAGMQAVLFKPLDPKLLWRTIAQCCLFSSAGSIDVAMPALISGPLHDSLVADMGHDVERIAAYLQLLQGDIETELNCLDQAILLEDRQGI